jgi:phosphate transport system protein
MTIFFQRELEKLRKDLLALGAQVEDALAKSIHALIERDAALAEQIMAHDEEVDRREIEVEESCLKILALHQPVAHDLRFLVAAMKMNNDLERMGDIAVNIAKRARWLARHDPLDWPPQFPEMADRVKGMVQRSLDALVNANETLARQVCAEDDIVDTLKRELSAYFRERIREQPEASETLVKMLDVPRHLERMADLATNIAEDVIYLVDGTIARHKHGSMD